MVVEIGFCNGQARSLSLDVRVGVIGLELGFGHSIITSLEVYLWFGLGLGFL